MEKENKKILNATPKEFDGIKFKSTLEVMVYKTLLSVGFEPLYEKNKFVIWQGLYPSVPFYDKDATTRMLKLNKKKIIDITYTPDFTFEYNKRLIIIEVKGFENDVFPVKKKLFRKSLEETHPEALFFEIYTKKQLLQAIQIIKKL
jgi:hypothetical protein